MTGLVLTPTRLALLRDVEDGEVMEQHGGQSTTAGVDTTDLVDVTAEIAELEAAVLVRRVEARPEGRLWKLTTPGRAVLAAGDKTEG